MPATVKKKQVELKVYGKAYEKIYTGRLLGLISPKEYAALISTPELKQKIVTVETSSLVEIGKLDDIEDFRLVLMVKKHGDIVVNSKKLFITEPLDQVSSLDATKKEITISGKESVFIMAKEVEVNV